MPSGKRKMILPPTCLYLAIVFMIALHYLFPVLKWIPFPLNLVGMIPMFLGLWINVHCSNLFDRNKTTVKPGEKSNRLVIEGFYRYTRHPMYIGMSALVLGLAILLGSLTPFLIMAAFPPIMHWFMIMEERDMEGIFGGEYREYKKRVRRWI